MAVKTQSVIDRIVFILRDGGQKRAKLTDISRFMNEAQAVLATSAHRAAAKDVTLVLKAGSRQDLRLIDAGKEWVRLNRLACNFVGDDPTGAAIRLVSREALDNAVADWRASPPASTVYEYAVVEDEACMFDVFPPAVDGTKVLAVATAVPPPICVLNTAGTALANSDEVIQLAQGFDIPLVDYTLFRLFSMDSNDPAYEKRAQQHLSLAQMAAGISAKG